MLVHMFYVIVMFKLLPHCSFVLLSPMTDFAVLHQQLDMRVVGEFLVH